jgi:alanine racemase
MKNPLTWLSKRRFPYTPLITIEISRSRLIHNINQFIKLAPKSRLAPALKSNAYGHGIIEVAEIIEGEIRKDNKFRNSIPFFVIDSYFEAIALRAKGIKTPLLIIGYTRPETILNSNLKNVSYAVTDMETLRAIKNSKKVIFVHLKIDTGMHRQGILPEEVDEAIKCIKSNKNITLEGICSHLSDADGQDSTFTDGQIALWNNIVNQISSSIPSIKYFHLSNTYGHLYSKQYQITHELI